MPLFKLSAKGTVTKRKGLRTWKTWEERMHQVMWLSIGIGFFVGVGVTIAVVSLTQSWFGWVW